VLLRRDGALIAVITISASAEGIDQLMWMINPGKLGAVGC
jgi:RNA polymerase sigma-70 factor (ECF subfamily)